MLISVALGVPLRPSVLVPASGIDTGAAASGGGRRAAEREELDRRRGALARGARAVQPQAADVRTQRERAGVGHVQADAEAEALARIARVREAHREGVLEQRPRV